MPPFRNANDSVCPGSRRSISLDGKTVKRSFDNFTDRKAAQLLDAFDTEAGLVLAHIDIAGKPNEIPAAQQVLGELNVADCIVTLDALHCQKTSSVRRPACGGRNGPRYHDPEGSGRKVFGGSVPGKKRGP